MEPNATDSEHGAPLPRPATEFIPDRSLPLRDYRLAAALVRACVAGTASLTELKHRWPEQRDPNLIAVRTSLRLWFRPGVQRNMSMRAILQTRLEEDAMALEAGKAVPDATSRRPHLGLWMMREYFMGLFG